MTRKTRIVWISADLRASAVSAFYFHGYQCRQGMLPDGKMPLTQRRRDTKAQSIFMVIGAGRHVACSENGTLINAENTDWLDQRSSASTCVPDFRCYR
jgi:hypothetical protein